MWWGGQTTSSFWPKAIYPGQTAVQLVVCSILNHIILEEVVFEIAPGTRYEVSKQGQGQPITSSGRELIVQKEEGKKKESSFYGLENSAATKSLSELSIVISFT